MASREDPLIAVALSAADNGRTNDVKKLLDSENTTLETRRAMADYAAAAGHIAVVELLVEGGHLQPKKMSNAFGLFGKKPLFTGYTADFTPLYYASVNGRHPVVSLLLNSNDISFSPQNINASLFVAAENGHLEVVELLLGAHADVTADCMGHETALHLAAKNGHDLVAQSVIEGKADVNKSDREGKTPLHLASERGHLKVVQLLLAEGANVALRDQWGHTALHMAAEGVFLYVSKGPHLTNESYQERNILELGWSCSQDRTVIIKALLTAGASTETQTRDGDTALHCAVRRGWSDVVIVLLEAGADINARNGKQETPLNIAQRCGHFDLLELLIQTPRSTHPATNASIP